MLRQIKRFECALTDIDGIEPANLFLRELAEHGHELIEVHVVPGERTSQAHTDSIYIVYGISEREEVAMTTIVAESPAELLETDVIGQGLGNGHDLPEDDPLLPPTPAP